MGSRNVWGRCGSEMRTYDLWKLCEIQSSQDELTKLLRLFVKRLVWDGRRTKAVNLDITSTDKLLSVRSHYHATSYQNWRATSSLLTLLFASSHAHGRHQPVDVITFIHSSSSSNNSSRLREHLADCRGDRSDGEEDDYCRRATRHRPATGDTSLRTCLMSPCPAVRTGDELLSLNAPATTSRRATSTPTDTDGERGSMGSASRFGSSPAPLDSQPTLHRRIKCN